MHVFFLLNAPPALLDASISHRKALLHGALAAFCA
jgi:hypothetical protein